MDEVLPTVDDLKSIFDIAKTDQTPEIPEIPSVEVPVDLDENAQVVENPPVQTEETTPSPFTNPNNDISSGIKTITPELSDEEVLARLAAVTPDSVVIAPGVSEELQKIKEVVKSGENDTVASDTDVTSKKEEEKEPQIPRDEKGKFKGGIAQETNKNGTAGVKGFDEEKEKEIVQKLREAFLFGCTDREACLFAGIGKSWLYEYQQENPDFVDQKEDWKDNTKMEARKNIHDAIKKGNADVSQWYLEHKANKEFSKRTQMTGGDGENVAPIKIEYVIPSKPKDTTDSY